MKALFGILVLIALALAARGLFQHFIVSTISSNSSDCLDVVGSTTSEVDGGTYITGSVRNSCDRDFGNVTISFKLDATPGPFGTMSGGGAFAYARNVKAGESKEFKTSMPVPKEATYRLEGINAF
jgi:hypothetical protein